MKRLLFPAIGATLVLSACGGGRHASGSYVIDYRPHVPRSSVTPLANRRERTAGREAEKLLERVPLPPGAVRLPAPAPTDQLAQSGLGVSVVNMTADRYSVWRVPGSGQAVIAFEKRHMLPGLHGEGVGSSPEGYASEEFYGPVVGGLPVQREVSATIEPRAGGTVLRLDAGVSWIYPRSPSEVVPAAVREIDIHGGGVARRVTAPTKVARIVRGFDALDAYQPGPSVSCVAILDSSVTFVFRSARGARLATALVPSSFATNCDPIEFSIGGKKQGSLIDSRSGRYAFAARVERLLGVRFTAPRR